MKPATLVNHPPAVVVPEDNHPLVAPIHQSVKFEFESVAETHKSLHGERAGFSYQRVSNPTTRQLELTLAALQAREDCLVCATGVAAINGTLLALTRANDHVLCFVETYGPTQRFIRRTLARFGVRSTMLSIEDLEGIERVLAATPTRLMIFESPSNPINRIADLGALTALARRYAVIASAETIKRLRPGFTLLGGASPKPCSGLRWCRAWVPLNRWCCPRNCWAHRT